MYGQSVGLLDRNMCWLRDHAIRYVCICSSPPPSTPLHSKSAFAQPGVPYPVVALCAVVQSIRLWDVRRGSGCMMILDQANLINPNINTKYRNSTYYTTPCCS